MDTFYIKAGSRLPYIKRKVIEKANGDFELVPIDDDADGYDLSNTTATFSMVSVSGAAVVNNSAADIYDNSNGLVQYKWADGDTGSGGVDDGMFNFYKESGESFSLPSEGFLKIVVGNTIP